jgi:hypothetical protein
MVMLSPTSSCYVELPGAPIATSCFPCRRGGLLEPAPGCHASSPPFLPIPWPPFPFFPVGHSFSLSWLTVARARRLAPPSCAFLSPADMLRSSVAPPSSSPSKELTRGGRSRRHHHGYLVRNELLCCQNSSSLAILWPSWPCRRLPGEPLVWPPHFPLLLSRRSRRHGRPLPASGSRSGWAIAPAD